jgi:excisionase family DNA binding protein
LTLKEAADELGVHYMTAYRYVRLGLMDADKIGGTWKVTPGAVAAFRMGSLRSPVAAGESAPWSDRLESRLIAGDARGAWGIIESAMTAGKELDEVYLDVLTPAMISIGERWSTGELDIAIEHRASGMAMRIIGQVGPRFARRGRARGTVITAAPPGENHTLPLAMISDLLRLEGWEVFDLGADLPAESLGSIVASDPDAAVAVGLSVSSESSLVQLAESCEAVRAAAPKLLIVAGGRAIRDDDHARSLGADNVAASSQQMSFLIQEHLVTLQRQATLQAT